MIQQDGEISPTKKIFSSLLDSIKNMQNKKLIVIAFLLLLIPFLSVQAKIFALFGVSNDWDVELLGYVSMDSASNMTILERNSSAFLGDQQGGADSSVLQELALVPLSGPESLINRDKLATGDVSIDTISLYVVQDGDTISEIAENFGVSINTIKWANEIDYNGKIIVGEELTILPIDGVRYEIEKGDTLSTIAEEFDADVSEIARFNGIANDAVVKIGQVILIPDGIQHDKTPNVNEHSVATGSYKTTNEVDASGYFIKPLSGILTQGLHPRNAVDWGALTGTPVVASASGTVILARSGGYSGGYGNYIVIEHSNGAQTLYAHLNSVATYKGASVTQGQVIGAVGSTGRSTGPHLHFEVRGAANPFAN